MLAEKMAFERLADSKSQEEWNEKFAGWRAALAARITAHVAPSAAMPQ